MHSLLELQPFDFHLFSVQCTRAEQGYYHKRRRLHYEMVYKIDGRSQQIFDDRTLELVPDTIYIIPRFHRNSYRVTESGTAVNIVFDIPNDEDFSSLEPEIIVLKAENKYKSQFLRAAKAWGYKDSASYFRTHAIVSEIFAQLFADREKRYFQKSKFGHILPAVEYIRQNFRSPITVSQLTELCGISDEYLRTLFRSYTGQTPLEYIHALRLTYAYELLTDGGISVAQAAAECGFANANYFSRLFKKRYAVSPSHLHRVEFKDPYGRNEPNDRED